MFKTLNSLFIYEIKGQLYCKINKKDLKFFLLFLRDHTNTLFKELIDCYGLDYNERIQRFEICYILLSLQQNTRIVITINLSEDQHLESISDIYLNAC